MTTALFLVVEPLIGQVIEPLVYGHSTEPTPVAVIIAATWLWGPIGLLLSTPLTVCLGVLYVLTHSRFSFKIPWGGG